MLPLVLHVPTCVALVHALLVREAHGTTEPFRTTRKSCIRYTGVCVDGWFRFIRFLLYTQSVVPEYSLCMRNHGTDTLIVHGAAREHFCV